MSFGIPAALLFGLVLIIASLSLFVTSKLKPNLYEDSDNIYVIVGVVCGLLLMVSLDLGAAMAFQQLLLLSATITLMWRFINLRAENKQLKNRQVGGERPKSVYNARLEDDYVDPPRERRPSKRRRSVGYEDEDRLLSDSQESAIDSTISRRRNRSSDTEDVSDRYRERRNPNWEDETDWNDSPSPRTPQRALPDADLIQERSPQRFDRDRQTRSTTRSARIEDRGWSETDAAGTTSEYDRERVDEESTPRRRRPRSTRPDPDNRQAERPADSRSAQGSMASYVNYEPVDPQSGLPSSGSEPIVFPDRY